MSIIFLITYHRKYQTTLVLMVIVSLIDYFCFYRKSEIYNCSAFECFFAQIQISVTMIYKVLASKSL